MSCILLLEQASYSPAGWGLESPTAHTGSDFLEQQHTSAVCTAS